MTKSRTLASHYSASAARLGMILDALRETADREAAQRAVTYCCARAAGGRENLRAEANITAIAQRHGLSLDWIFDSNAKAA